MSNLRNRTIDPGRSEADLICRKAFGPPAGRYEASVSVEPVRWGRPATTGLSLAIGLLVLWGLIDLRYGYRLEDSVLYLPIAKHQLHPGLYPDSPLIEHLRRMPYPLYKSMAVLFATPVGEHAHIAATVAMRLLFVGVLFGFMTTLTRQWWLGLIAATGVLLQPAFYGTLAWTELISPELVQSDLGKIAMMLAVVAYLRGGLITTALILGVGFHLHPILSLCAAVLLLPDALWRRREHGAARLIGALLVGGALALPAAVGVMRSLSLSVASPGRDHVEMIRFFNYFHVIPSEFHRWEYVGFFGLAGAGTVAFLVLWPKLGERRWILLRMGIGIALWCGVGLVTAEWLEHTLFMQMMPFRITYMVRLLSMGLIVAAAGDALLRREAVPFLLLGGWLVASMIAVKLVPWLSVAVAAWLLATRRDRSAMVALGVSLLALGAVVWIDPAQIPKLQTIPWPALAVVGLGWLLVWLERSARIPTDPVLARTGWPFTHVGRVAWLGAIVLAGIVTVRETPKGVWRPRLAARAWLDPTGHRYEADPWQDVMRWARTQTSPEASFITPPDLFGWTHYSERNTLATYQLGMQSVWDKRYAPIMRQRLTDLGVTERWAPGPNYHAFNPKRLLGLARVYGVDYVVWKRAEPARMPWPIAYENDAYLVYGLREVKTAEADAERRPNPTTQAVGDVSS